MNLEELANEVFVKLESLAIQGFDLGKEMVLKEVAYQIWLQQFVIKMELGFVLVAAGYFVLVALARKLEWGDWDDCDDLIDHGFWFAGIIFAISFMVAGLIMIPCALASLKHLEFNPVYYVLKAML